MYECLRNKNKPNLVFQFYHQLQSNFIQKVEDNPSSTDNSRITIEGAFQLDELGSSTVSPLLIEESSVYLDLFSLEEDYHSVEIAWRWFSWVPLPILRD